MADNNEFNTGDGRAPERRGGPARPRTAAGSSSGASQDTMQFIALANKNREQAAGAGRPSGAAGSGAGDGADGSTAAWEAAAAGSGQTAGFDQTSGAFGSDTEDFPRIDTEFGQAGPGPDAFQGPAASDRADYFDFNISYGSTPEHEEDGLVRHRHRRGERRRKVIVRTVVVVLILLVVALGVSGFMLARSAFSVKDRAQEAVALVTSVKDKVTSGEFSGLPEDAAQLDSLCAELEQEVSGPLWQAASMVPVVGSDVSAARELVSVLADVSSGALVPMADQLAQATPGKLFADGSINVSAVCAVVDSLAASADVLEQANERVQAIGDTHIPQVTELVDTAKSGFSVLDGAVSASKQLSPVLPAMLGADGARSYLVVAQNNVEIRANGGLGGSQGVITVTDGHMEIGDFRGSLRVDDSQAVQLTDEEENLFNKMTGNVGKVTGDATMIPDFPRAASIMAQLWQAGMGQHVDGIIALDPVFLQYLLALVGNVSLPDGTVVDGTNAATVLMHDVYWNYPQEQSDAIFASVADAAFKKILGGIGDADMAELVATFQRGCEEGRFIVWMENGAEEDAIKALGIANALPDAADLTAAPQTGVYLNNVGYSKMDWYLDLDVDMSSGMEHGDGTTTYQMTVNVKNTITEDEAANLPGYVGVNKWTDNGGIELVPLERYIVYLVAPAGGSISDVQVTGDGGMTMKEGAYNGLGVTYGMLDLYTQQQCTITYTVTVPAEAQGDLTLRVSPTCQEVREESQQQ